MSAAGAPLFPPAVHLIWGITLGVTLVVFVPLTVYFLHRTWRAVRSIERYAAETLAAAGGIAGNTRHVPALDATAGVAVELLPAAGAVERQLETVARLLEERAR
jgi:hypothetical protein